MSLKGDWGYMNKIFRHPCHNGSIAIFASTGIRAAATAAFDFATFGCREPLKFAAGRGQAADYFGYGNVRKNPMPHRRPKVPRALQTPPTVAGGSAAFWYLSARVERGLFYWFLANLAGDFVVNWTTLMYQENGCDGPFAGRCSMKITDQVCGDEPTQMLIVAVNDCGPILSDIRSWQIPSGIQASVSYHFESDPWAPDPGPPGQLQSWIQCLDTGQVYGAGENGGPLTTDNGNVGHGDHLNGGLGTYQRFALMAKATTGSRWWCHDGWLQFTLSGRRVPLFAVQDCFKTPAKLF